MTADTLTQLCVERNLSTRQVAKELGYSQSTIRYWLKKHGIRKNKAHSYTECKDSKSALNVR